VSTSFPGVGANDGSQVPGDRRPAFPGLPDAASGRGHGPSQRDDDAFFPQPGTQPSAGGPRSGPPVALFAAAVAVPLVSLPLLLLDGWGWHVLGWAVATLGTAGLLIVATLTDTQRRASVWYLGRDPLVPGLRLTAVVLALVAATAHAWLFADWFSRLAVFSA
jgi:hypothetical protein